MKEQKNGQIELKRFACKVDSLINVLTGMCCLRFFSLLGCAPRKIKGRKRMSARNRPFYPRQMNQFSVSKTTFRIYQTSDARTLIESPWRENENLLEIKDSQLTVGSKKQNTKKLIIKKQNITLTLTLTLIMQSMITQSILGNLSFQAISSYAKT